MERRHYLQVVPVVVEIPSVVVAVALVVAVVVTVALVVAAVVVVLAGLFLLTYDFDTRINPGDLITLITTATYAIHLVFAGQFVKKADIFAIVTYQFVAASIVSGIAYLLSDTSSLILSEKSIWSIVYLGLAGTLFCYFITVWVQKFVSAVKVAVLFSLEPVFAAGFGYIMLHEVLNHKELLGASIIFIGVVAYQVWEQKKGKAEIN